VQFGAPDPKHALFFLNACSVNGVLCLTLCYDTPAVSDHVASDLADAILSELQAASAPARPSAGPAVPTEEEDASISWEMLDDMLPADVGRGMRCISSSRVASVAAARRLAESHKDCVGFAYSKDLEDFQFKQKHTGFSTLALARPCEGWEWHYIVERASPVDLPDGAGRAAASAVAETGEAVWPSGTGRGAISFKYRHVGQEFSAVGWFEKDGDSLIWTSRTGSPEDPSTWRPRNTWSGLRLVGTSLQNGEYSCDLECNDAGVVTLVTWGGGYQWRLFDVAG